MEILQRALVALLLVLAPTLSAQTTGVPGINDYTVAGAGSGSVSCTTQTLTVGSVAVFEVDAGLPNVQVGFLFSFCPCNPCWFPMAPVACAIPPSACGGSNQSIDIDLSPGCGPVVVVAVTDAAGRASIGLPIPAGALGLHFSTQAAILGNPCSGFSPLLTQAYDLSVDV